MIYNLRVWINKNEINENIHLNKYIIIHLFCYLNNAKIQVIIYLETIIKKIDKIY